MLTFLGAITAGILFICLLPFLFDVAILLLKIGFVLFAGLFVLVAGAVAVCIGAVWKLLGGGVR